MEGVKLWGLITKSLLSSGTSSSGASGSGKIIGVSSLDLCFFFFFSDRESSTSDMVFGLVRWLLYLCDCVCVSVSVRENEGF